MGQVGWRSQARRNWTLEQPGSGRREQQWCRVHEWRQCVAAHHRRPESGPRQRIEGLRKSVAGDGQRLLAPKNWIGSDSVNLFQVVCDLLDLVQEMNTQLAGHTHGSSPVPANALAFNAAALNASSLLSAVGNVTMKNLKYFQL